MRNDLKSIGRFRDSGRIAFRAAGVMRVAHIAWLVLVASFIAGTAYAADKSQASAKPAAPMSQDAARDMLSRMSDEDARKMLLEQLERSAPAPAKPAAAMGDMSGMVSMVHEESARFRERVLEIGRAAADLPEALATVRARLVEGRGPSHLAVLAGGFAVMLAIGALFEFLFRRATRRLRQRLEASQAGTFGEGVVAVGSRFLLDIAALVVFGVAALATFLLAWQGHEPSRHVVLTALIAVMNVRLVATLSRMLLSPRAPALRLVGVDDDLARSLFRTAVAVAAIVAFGLATMAVFNAFGVAAAVTDFLTFVVSTLALVLLLTAVWRSREALRTWIAGPVPSRPLRRMLADGTPAALAVYLVAVYVARIDALVSGRDIGSAGILSIVVLIAVPLVDAALCRWVKEAAASSPQGDAQTRASFITSYQGVLTRAIHIVTTLVAALAIARLWGIDLFALAERNMGARIAGALFGILIVLLIAYLLWQIAFTAIGRRMQAETFDDHTPASRLRTLLPVIRVTLQIAIVVITTLSVLAALGINILPLLAGASILGVAIGFGSQTLVRDVVSGAFFMMDDAFRLGEYIEVGDAKGRVEKITVRSVFLRHHRGALNILPYGEVKRIRNTSRDWIILTMEFRLKYDTDLNKVKKILKRIGEELKADPDYADDLLEPLKSQGVMSAEDSALIVRAKFMARPGDAPWIIRRVAYQKILKAFSEEGIRFAHREVTVHVPPDENVPPKAIASAATIIPIEGSQPTGT